LLVAVAVEDLLLVAAVLVDTVLQQEQFLRVVILLLLVAVVLVGPTEAVVMGLTLFSMQSHLLVEVEDLVIPQVKVPVLVEVAVVGVETGEAVLALPVKEETAVGLLPLALLKVAVAVAVLVLLVIMVQRITVVVVEPEPLAI